jgi:2-hydroxy-3-keto-5-methylthiopentenyl-1-phosphate phosphatase
MRKNQMAFILDDDINKYIQGAGDTDKKVARHLKEIIPKTTHLEENTFNKIIEELKKEMDTGESFKITFQKVCQKYVLAGHIITAELPDILTRIIANKRLFFEFLKFRLGIDEVEIKNRIISKGIHYFIRLIGHLDLAPPHSHVVFAVFDEENMEADPFSNYTVNDILNMLGKDKRNFKEGESLSAVKIRYRNQK